LEVWNLVFMEFDRAADGTLTPLPFKSVDTGMGLERITSAVQGVDSNYRTDLFMPIIERLAEFIGHDPDTVESERFSYQVVADHSRAMTFLIAEGVTPSNDGAGYVLRRIMRRAVRHGRLMGITQPFLRQTCAVVIEKMGDAYPLLSDQADRILAEVEAEEGKFARTLEAGTEKLLALIEAAGGNGFVSGDEAFRLHDTFGFPIDLTVEIAAESGVGVDREGFDRAMAEQRERSRGAKASRFTPDPSLAAMASEFIGYPNETRAEGLAVMGLAGDPEATQVVLDRTPFYAEGGGQIGDRGELRGPRGKLLVEDVQRSGDAIVHVGRLEGELEIGEPVEAHVDAARRAGAARNHTGTHLLHRALRDVLGEQAKQAGSWVGPDGLRFDFPASAATPRAQLREVERRVNEQIRRNASVQPAWMSLGEAQELGADMFFGEKYVPENVRVVQVDGYSKELCGGTHVSATGEIGSFRITGESSIGAGLRRIEAVTGEGAEALIERRLEALHDAAALLGVGDEEVPARVEVLSTRLREAEKAAREPSADGGPRLDAAAALAEAQEAGDSRVIVQHYPEADAAALRRWADELRGITGRFVAVAGGERGGPSLLVAASRDLTGEGFDAVAIVRQVGPMIGGGGGGRPELAQAGGRDASRLREAVGEAARLALEALAPIESG
jgi:alanyl-tRNA synthetase